MRYAELLCCKNLLKRLSIECKQFGANQLMKSTSRAVKLTAKLILIRMGHSTLNRLKVIPGRDEKSCKMDVDERRPAGKVSTKKI